MSGLLKKFPYHSQVVRFLRRSGWTGHGKATCASRSLTFWLVGSPSVPMCSRSLLYDQDQDMKFLSISTFLVRLLCHSLAMCLLAQEGPSGQRKWTCLSFSPFINFLVLSLFGWLFGWPGSLPVQSELTTSSKAGGSTTGRLTVSCSITFTSTVDAVFWWIMRALKVRCWQSCPEGPIRVPSHCDLRTLKRNRKIHDEVDFFFWPITADPEFSLRSARGCLKSLSF